MLSAPSVHPVRVSALQVRGITEAIADAGGPVERFMASAGHARLADPSGWFSLEEFDALMVAAVRYTNDPAFGLHWGERSPMMQFDMAPALVATAPTLRGAIEALLAFQPIVASQEECVLCERRDRGRIVFALLACSELGKQVRSELLATAFWRLLRHKNVSSSLRRVNFMHGQPAHASEYTRLFGDKVFFDQPEYSIELSRSALDRGDPLRNVELHAQLQDRTARLRRHALGQLSYSEQVEQRIRSALPRLLSSSDAAVELELSERSLRRRLSEEGVSYGELVERVQRERAEKLLAQGELPVKEMARELGYDSMSGFYRAFRRWTGDTPARARTPRARS